MGQIEHSLIKEGVPYPTDFSPPHKSRTTRPSSLALRLLQTQTFVVSTVLAMNAFPNGTRVFYWTSSGEIKYGTVQGTNRMADASTLRISRGTQIVVVLVDGEDRAQLPDFSWDQSICQDLPSKSHDLTGVTTETDKSGESICHPINRVSLIPQYDLFMIAQHNWGLAKYFDILEHLIKSIELS
ncbi:hypothetical protein M405DRAFT_839631 [Rhizopogon salebrosus TDB-379]|nr:hypothetical protein M405DRAFT_839631 [Rhizopogon salebrosus TDB-379]